MFAFLFWVGATVIVVRVLRRSRPYLRFALSLAISGSLYLLFGLLIAPSQFGGEAEFLYEPTRVIENLLHRGGLQAILLWPFYVLSGG